MTKVQTSAIASMLLAIVGSAAAQTPLGSAFTYQGLLKESGQAAPGPTVNLVFRLYDVSAGGAALATDAVGSWPIQDGLFTVDLDFGSAAFNGDARWLEVEVDGETLSPRQALTATPQAMFSMNADKLDGLDSTAFLQSIPAPLTLSGTNPGSYIILGENASPDLGSSAVRGHSTAASGLTFGVIGVNDSNSGRGVAGQATSTTGAAWGVQGASASTDGRGVYGIATAVTGSTHGGYFESASTSGRGVFGLANAASGVTYGGRFESASTSGQGVYGVANAQSGTTYGGVFSSGSTSGTGVFGVAPAVTGLTYGVQGESNSTSGRGVFGYASATTGAPYGGYFQTQSTGGYGAFGYATATTGTTYGLFGQSDSTSGRGVYGLASTSTGTTYGVYGRSDSTSGRGVFGLANTSSGVAYGGYFQCNSTSGAAVFGLANAGSGSTYGGYFQNDSTTGRAVSGVAGAGTGVNYGGHFQSASTSGYGVYGLATYAGSGTTYGVFGQSNSFSGRGVYGYASTTGAYGVYGYEPASGLGYAVYANGDLGASGNKPFRIDHPIDPENKYLLHYSVESPEVLNAYSGKVTLDDRGEGVVELPDYFASINKDPRYTLTAVGAPMPMLHVAEEISEEALAAGEQAEPGDAPPICWFRIAGGVAGAKVSWEVKAVRNDLRIRLYGAPVERDKTGPERGKYQHPEYYGQPPEMGMDYQAEQSRPAESPVGPEMAPR